MPSLLWVKFVMCRVDPILALGHLGRVNSTCFYLANCDAVLVLVTLHVKTVFTTGVKKGMV